MQVFAGLLVGAMLPFWFSAMTMKSVGKAALAMVEEVGWGFVRGFEFRSGFRVSFEFGFVGLLHVYVEDL